MDNKKKTINGNDIPNEESQSDKKSFDFLKVFVEHLTRNFKHFVGKDLANAKNADFIDRGRTDEERNQIAELCESIDEHYALLAELRNSNKEPEDWLKEKTEEILSDCTPEVRGSIIQAVNKEGAGNAETQAVVLKALAEEIQNSEPDSTKQED